MSIDPAARRSARPSNWGPAISRDFRQAPPHTSETCDTPLPRIPVAGVPQLDFEWCGLSIEALPPDAAVVIEHCEGVPLPSCGSTH